MSQTHVFTLSGLGQSPFYLHNPVGQEIADTAGVFFCEHCGTVLKNRHFIKSSDGKVSVVGIDCLNKSGDNGLIDSFKEQQRKSKREARINHIEQKQAEHKDREIARFGETVEVLVENLHKEAEVLTAEIENELEISAVGEMLSKNNFGQSMLKNIVRGEKLSENMIAIIKEIITKDLSGSKKNSKAYKEAIPVAEQMFDDMIKSIGAKSEKVAELKAKRVELLNTRV